MAQSRGGGGEKPASAFKDSTSRSILADVLGSPVAIANMPPIFFILDMLAASLKSSCPNDMVFVLHQMVQLVKILKKPTGTFF